MAIFYVGSRPVMRGRNSNEWVHLWKGVTGTYSNYSLMSSTQMLSGMPNEDHLPGAGRHPHGITLSRRFRGLDTLNPLDGPGSGQRIEGMRYRPLENKAAGNNLVFKSGYGHAVDRGEDYELYSNEKYDGVPSGELFVDPGHAVRAPGAAGTAATFGSFGPLVHKGATLAMASVGQDPATATTYGRKKVNEWAGVTSTKALNV